MVLMGRSLVIEWKIIGGEICRIAVEIGVWVESNETLFIQNLG